MTIRDIPGALFLAALCALSGTGLWILAAYCYDGWLWLWGLR